ncbi:MAG: DUF4838 domain-containing protein [Clostridia bacterium]|nr:DUF4838 domain-containing protein [Clostridia bacterium]
MIIKALSEQQTVAFAKSELEKYLFLLDKKIPDTFVVELGFMDKTDDEIDTVEVNIGKNGGTLKGSNPRSVLYAVYQYLEALGIRWVRHCQDGEYIPTDVRVAEKEISFIRTAKNKYRGMTIEGGVTIDLMLSDIDWCAKMGHNVYALQFFDQTLFFERWASHFRNPLWIDGRRILPAEAMEYRNKMVFEIKKRGMYLNSGGHGLTCTPFGVALNAKGDEVPEEMKDLLAMIDGKRRVHLSIGNTQLCYSNPKVTEKLAGFIANYARENPEVDFYDVSFADAMNNQCECENCQKILPGDGVVRIINRADEIMTKEGLKMKLNLSLYLDNLWSATEKVNNPDRVNLVFAPIGRNYKVSYDEMTELPEIPEFVRNKNENPTDIALNIAFLKKWKEAIPGAKAFSWEYFNWNTQRYVDMGNLNASEIVYRDIQALEQVGLDGILNCQSQRSFLPTGLAAYMHAKTFWHSEKAYMDLVKEYYEGAFGQYADLFYNHFRSLSNLSKEEESCEKSEKLLELVNRILSEIAAIEKEQKLDNPCHVQSVFYAKYHAMVFQRIAQAELVYYRDGSEKSMPEWQKIIDFVRKTEASVYNVFDLVHFINYLKCYVRTGYVEVRKLLEQEEEKKGYVFF